MDRVGIETTTMSTSNTSTTSFYTKVKIISDFVGMPNKTQEHLDFIYKYGSGCYLAYHLHNGYFDNLNKGLSDINEAWENLLARTLGQDIWDDDGNILPEFDSLDVESLMDLQALSR